MPQEDNNIPPLQSATPGPLGLSNIARLEPGKTDAELAEEFRAAARPHLEALARLGDLASKQKMILQWTFSQNSFGQRYVQEIQVLKLL